MKYKRLELEAAQKLFFDAGIPAVLETDDGKFNCLRVTVGDTHIKIQKESYGEVKLLVPEAVEKTKVTINFGSDGLPNGEKLFDLESEAIEYVDKLKDKFMTATSDWDIQFEQVHIKNADMFLVTSGGLAQLRLEGAQWSATVE